MKVVFLDVDGVLTYSNYRNPETSDIDVEKVKLLKEICDKTNAKVVISSSWKGTRNRVPHIYSTLLKVLSDNDISVIGNTPYVELLFEDDDFMKTNKPIPLIAFLKAKVKHGTGRAAEIEKWINENNPERFVVLDDENYDWAEYNYENNWVQTTWDDDGGLKKEHVEMAIRILNS